MSATVSNATQIQVSGLGGPLCSVTVDTETATIEEVKEAIAVETGIPVNEQRLLHGVQELQSATLHGFLTGANNEMRGCFLLQMLRRPPEQVRRLRELAQVQGDVSRWLCAAPHEVQADREVVLAALVKSGRALRWAARELQADREVVLVAVAENGCALAWATAELRADRNVVLAAVAENGCALMSAAGELRADREVVLVAVAEVGLALEYASAELQADREVVLVAVAENGYALQYTTGELQADREVVFSAVSKNGQALQFAAPELEADPDMLRTANVGLGMMVTPAATTQQQTLFGALAMCCNSCAVC